VQSDWKRSEGKAGKFRHTAGRYSGDPDDKGFIFILCTNLADDVDKISCLPYGLTAAIYLILFFALVDIRHTNNNGC
jgi:hypothetical protein